jgi:adenylosuccinate lyase
MIERYTRPAMKRVWSDENKFNKWLEVETAVCEAWAEFGVIPRSEIPKIKMARVNLKRMAKHLKETHHDMTAFLATVAESLGPESRFIHLGMTSSDVMDTALSLQLIEAADILDEDVKELIDLLTAKAIEHKYTAMVGRTHGIHAEPISFGLKLAIWLEEMKRNRRRLTDAKKAVAVGKISGAVGTYATLSPEIEEIACRRLKLEPAPISNQVLQRDRHAQFATTLAIIGTSLEKFATEIRGLQRTEVGEVEEFFAAGQTGSSAMPHKRNPELSERICGLARLLRGYALTSLENVALWHERDISHSSAERIILPDATSILDYGLTIFTDILRGLAVHTDRMKQNLKLTHGLIFSQRVMLALISKGMPRQQAYKLVQRHAMKAWDKHKSLAGLLKTDDEVTAKLSAEELDGLFDEQYYLRFVNDIFQRLGLTDQQWHDKTARPNRGKRSPRSI